MVKMNYEYLFEKGIDKQKVCDDIINLFIEAKKTKKGANELIIKVQQNLTLGISYKDFCNYITNDSDYLKSMFIIIDECKPRQQIKENVIIKLQQLF